MNSPATPSEKFGGADEDSLAPLSMGVVIIGGILFAVLMALSTRYGFDRDELYFLDSARHLQGGYVDQPALVALMARVSVTFFGVSVWALRLWPALAGWGTVVVTGMIARECGGARRAQILAAIGVITMPAVLAADHLMGPTAFDLLTWAGLAFIVLRVGRTGDYRWWLPAGCVLGIGLANKHSIAFLAIAIVIGIVVSGGGRTLWNRWFVLGGLIAFAFTVPDLIWQAQHGWATLTMTRHLNQENGGTGEIPVWIVGQLLMTSLATLPMWVVGLRTLWRSDRRQWRALAIAYALLFVFFAITTGGKIYYLAGAYLYLLGVGAVAVDRWLSRGRARLPSMAAAIAITTVLVLPIVLPVLPPSSASAVYSINQVPGESIGWPELVRTVDTVWLSLPSSRRARLIIVATDYGEAGAINELGRGEGLHAVGDQNSEWWWGPGKLSPTTVIVVAPGPRDVTGYAGYLRQYFGHVSVAATIRNRVGIHNQEWGGHVYLCTAARRPWTAIWIQLKHYD